MGNSVLFGQSLYSENKYRLIHILLGTAILIHAVSLFLMVFTAHQTHWGNYLFLVIGMPNAQAIFIEKITVSIFLLLAVAAVLRPRVYLIFPVFVYVFFEAYAGYFQGGYRFSEWTLATYALRYITPLALMALFLPGTRIFTNNFQLLTAGWLLRIGLFTVFLIHGLECLARNPQFIDFLIGSVWNLAGFRIMESTATQILQVIGIVDIIVASAVLVRPWKTILWWMAFWGMLTAFSRVTTLGWGAYFEVMLRASHVIAPIILLEINRQWHTIASKAGNDIRGIGDLVQRRLWDFKN